MSNLQKNGKVITMELIHSRHYLDYRKVLFTIGIYSIKQADRYKFELGREKMTSHALSNLPGEDEPQTSILCEF